MAVLTGLQGMVEPSPAHYAVELERIVLERGNGSLCTPFSLNVERGAILALVGPKGAGKTRLLRLLATLDAAVQGCVRIEGVDASSEPRAVRTKVGYMPEQFGFHRHLTVDEYVWFFAGAQDVPKSIEGALRNDLLELMDLTEYRSESVDALAPELKQRLSLARCLLHDPSVLLLDEPFRGLSAEARGELATLVRSLADLDKTVVVSAEDAGTVDGICSHLALMAEGTVVSTHDASPTSDTQNAGLALSLRFSTGRQLMSALKILEEQPSCAKVRPLSDFWVEAEFHGGEMALPSLLSVLTSADVSVREVVLGEHQHEGIADESCMSGLR